MTEPAIHNVMDETEIGILLGRIAAFDARTVGQSEITAWLLIAQRGRWTLTEATEQVINYFSTDAGTNWLMPGRINTMIRMARQDSAMRQPTDLMGDPPPGHGGVPRDVMAAWRKAREEAKAECKRRKDLVLRHPDIAVKLTQTPLNYERPDQWNGYIPPVTIPDHTTNVDGYVENNSPRLAAFRALVREAELREEATT